MKTINHIIFAVVVLSMIFGGLIPVFSQSEPLFSETVPSGNIYAALAEDDLVFQLLDRSDTTPESALLGSCRESDAEKLMKHLQNGKISQGFPENTVFAWGLSSREGKKLLYALRKTHPDKVPGTSDIQSVSMNDEHHPGTYDLYISFDERGKELWSQLTRENTGRNIAIVVEGKVVSAPKVQEEIKFGKCMISGNFSKDQAETIKESLEN